MDDASNSFFFFANKYIVGRLRFLAHPTSSTQRKERKRYLILGDDLLTCLQTYYPLTLCTEAHREPERFVKARQKEIKVSK